MRDSQRLLSAVDKPVIAVESVNRRAVLRGDPRSKKFDFRSGLVWKKGFRFVDRGSDEKSRRLRRFTSGSSFLERRNLWRRSNGEPGVFGERVSIAPPLAVNACRGIGARIVRRADSKVRFADALAKRSTWDAHNAVTVIPAGRSARPGRVRVSLCLDVFRPSPPAAAAAAARSRA